MVLQVYELPLESNGSPTKERSYVRLPPPAEPYVLRISIEAGSSASRQGCLYTSFPLDGSVFERTKFHKRELPTDPSKAIEVDIVVDRSGVFEFYVDHEDDSGKRISGEHCYFNVDPLLNIVKRAPILDAKTGAPLSVAQGGGKLLKETVPISSDGLVIQTVIAKWMGNLDEWAPHLEATRDRGYNMLHFPPLQPRGASNSPYSPFDQLSFADDLFTHLKSKKPLEAEEKQKIMQAALKDIYDKYGLLSMTDVVLNHTANNSEWLQDHPEAGYNMVNSPHLESAVELDLALLKFSNELAQHGLPTDIQSEEDLKKIVQVLQDKIIPQLKLWEYYVLDVAAEKAAFTKAWNQTNSPSSAPAALAPPARPQPTRKNSKNKNKSVNGVNGTVKAEPVASAPKPQPSPVIDQDPKSLSRADMVQLFASLCLSSTWQQLAGRSTVRVNLPMACAFMSKLLDAKVGNDTENATNQFGKILDDLNVDRYKVYNSDVQAIAENCFGRPKFQRLEPHGPKLGPVTAEAPLWDNFFTKIPSNSRTSKHDPRSLYVANNGWIWNGDPLIDFAGPTSRVYTRREVISWGDCVKLRFGKSEADSPFLWKHMENYVISMAKVFHGFRIDNCHSTPVHVGEKLLDVARSVNPNLYICAELFSGSEERDVHITKRLGLNSLIREAMNGNDPKDLSRLLYIYGIDRPIGSMAGDCLAEKNKIMYKGKETDCVIQPLQGSKPHAFMMDCTHDNEAPNFKQTAESALALGALVSFCGCSVGSSKGFDDFYGKLLDVVGETRKYEKVKYDSESSIGAVKRVLNHLHTEMVQKGFAEGHLHQENDYIFSHRVHPGTHEGILVIAHCAFNGTSKDRGYISPIKLRGTKVKYLMGHEVNVESRETPEDKDIIKGLPVKVTSLKPVEAAERSDTEGQFSEIVVPDYFPPGSVMVFTTSGSTPNLSALCSSGAVEAFQKLDLIDLNVLLYRADGEERDLTGGQDGVYSVPGLGALVYCGLEGWMHPLRHVMRHNDLGHPLCGHLRDGSWALDYVQGRLEKQISTFSNLKGAVEWFKERFDAVKQAPAFMRPKYFAMIINAAYKAARDSALAQMSDFVRSSHSFTHGLALCSVQMNGIVKSASIDPFKELPSLAAGLPHFAAGWARVWGRDVCISIRGLLLVTGQFDQARAHLLAFASTLKHGLIPNLIDSIKTPRYNSRDSPFWFLQNVQDYCNLAPEGTAFLKESAKRRFPKDDTWIPHDDPQAYAYSSTVAEVLQEILQRHASGIHFREYNAGPALDMQMRSEGFQIDIETDWKTGLIKGGSGLNCGTWMDKMGESEKAGTKGLPGTARDGAPVEITGLLKSTLRWLDGLSKSGKFPFKGVEIGSSEGKKLVTYKQWGDLLQKSFEEQYYVPADPKEDSKYAVDTKLINRRGIYKDVVGSGAGREYSDYQLRANFPIAMAVAPELFDPQHALGALQTYGDVLYGPLGIKTLDPSDNEYRPNYDNANDSSDPAIAKGRNYHQGPEWAWPAGYYLRAFLHFDSKVGQGKQNVDYTLHSIYSKLAPAREHLRNDPWAGIPELTNENGAYCHDSCRTQAWSASTILDVLYDIYSMKKEQ